MAAGMPRHKRVSAERIVAMSGTKTATISLPRRRNAGRPPFEPTADQRQMVERAVGLGIAQDRIAALVGISKPVLEKHFREELDRGMVSVEYQVGSSLVEQALKGNVNAQSLYLSRRAGWKETQVIENRDSRLDSMSEDEIIKELADRANKLGIKIDVNIGEQHPHALERNHRSKRRG